MERAEHPWRDSQRDAEVRGTVRATGPGRQAVCYSSRRAMPLRKKRNYHLKITQNSRGIPRMFQRTLSSDNLSRSRNFMNLKKELN